MPGCLFVLVLVIMMKSVSLKFLKWETLENVFRICPVTLSRSFLSCAFFPPANNLQNIVNWRGVPVSLPFSTLGEPRPPGTYNLSPGDTSTFLALGEPCLVFPHWSKTCVKSFTQVGKLVVMMTPCVPISWDLCILSLKSQQEPTP